MYFSSILTSTVLRSTCGGLAYSCNRGWQRGVSDYDGRLSMIVVTGRWVIKYTDYRSNDVIVMMMNLE